MKNVNIPGYIIRNLKEYGNAAIGSRTFSSRVSSTDVLNALKEEGLNCRIVITNLEIFEDYGAKRRKNKIGKVIELLK